MKITATIDSEDVRVLRRYWEQEAQACANLLAHKHNTTIEIIRSKAINRAHYFNKLENQIKATNYLCTVCGANPVDAANGFDTCESCRP
jgi:hypothetical protein